MPQRKGADYCPTCLRTFGMYIPSHVTRSYSITPLEREVLARMRRG